METTAKTASSRSRRISKGRDSELKIIRAALKIFGMYSFEGATTRMVAEEANVNLGALSYYFENKQSLYRAVTEYTAAELQRAITPMIEKAKTVLDDDASTNEDLIEALNDLFSAFGELVITSEDARPISRFLMREQVDPTPSFDIIYEGVTLKLNKIATQIIGKVINKPARTTEVLIRMNAILGQIVILEASREAIMRSTRWKDYNKTHFAMADSIIREHTSIVLKTLAEEAD